MARTIRCGQQIGRQPIRPSNEEGQIAAAPVAQLCEMFGEGLAGKLSPAFIQGNAMGAFRKPARKLGGFLVHTGRRRGKSR